MKGKFQEVDRYKRDLEKLGEELRAAQAESARYLVLMNKAKGELGEQKSKAEANKDNMSESLKKLQADCVADVERLQKKASSAERGLLLFSFPLLSFTH